MNQLPETTWLISSRVRSCVSKVPASFHAPLPARPGPQRDQLLSAIPLTQKKKKCSYSVSTYYVLGNVLALSIYHLLDSSQQPSSGAAIKFLFMKGEQIHQRILSVQQVSIRAGVAPRPGWPAAYGLTTLYLGPSVFMYKGFCVLGI